MDAVDLSGAWAMEVIVASTTKAPIFGEVASTSRSRLFVQVSRDGEGWVQRQKLCTTTVEGGSKFARTVIPDAWTNALPDRSYPVALALEDGAWAWRADTGVQIVGYDAQRGAFPTRAAEPQVVDSDRDGKPGATVQVIVPGFGAAEVFVAHRGHSRLEGVVVAPDRVEGRVLLVAQQQATLGASHPVFDFSPNILPDEENSRFSMWRVSGVGCGAVAGR